MVKVEVVGDIIKVTARLEYEMHIKFGEHSDTPEVYATMFMKDMRSMVPRWAKKASAEMVEKLKDMPAGG